MILAPGTRLLFIGDSITDGERARPVGEGLFGAEGKSYVALVNAHLQATRPQERIRVVNMGISGNTVADLEKRWTTDVLDLRPDWLSIMIGINDVWRQHDLPNHTEIHIREDDYTATLDRLVRETRPRLQGLILMTPFFIEPNRKDPMRAMMDRYGGAVKTIARNHDALIVDTQAAFDTFLEHRHSSSIAWDRIHPNLTGHTLLARAFLQAIRAL
jgi:lysophospholipase L1-like esterase